MFPNPHTVDVKRESNNRYLTGDGVTRSLGVELTTKIMSQVLRAVFEFNVRRTKGPVGQLNRYKVAAENTLRYEYLGSDYLPSAWPTTMVLQVSTSPLGFSLLITDFVAPGIVVRCCCPDSQRLLSADCVVSVPYLLLICKSRTGFSKSDQALFRGRLTLFIKRTN